MKKLIHLSLLAILVISFSSCSKFMVTPEQRIEGTWRLQNVDRYGNHGWEDVYTGYENGSFSFFRDGSASYTDSYGTLHGYWSLRNVTEGYYDENGHYGEHTVQVFSINLKGHGSSSSFIIDFDDFSFNGGNRIVAGYQTSGYDYRYEFVRY